MNEDTKALDSVNTVNTTFNPGYTNNEKSIIDSWDKKMKNLNTEYKKYTYNKNKIEIYTEMKKIKLKLDCKIF